MRLVLVLLRKEPLLCERQTFPVNHKVVIVTTILFVDTAGYSKQPTVWVKFPTRRFVIRLQRKPSSRQIGNGKSVIHITRDRIHNEKGTAFCSTAKARNGVMAGKLHGSFGPCTDSCFEQKIVFTEFWCGGNSAKDLLNAVVFKSVHHKGRLRETRDSSKNNQNPQEMMSHDPKS